MKGTPFFFLVASLVKNAFYASKYMYFVVYSYVVLGLIIIAETRIYLIVFAEPF